MFGVGGGLPFHPINCDKQHSTQSIVNSFRLMLRHRSSTSTEIAGCANHDFKPSRHAIGSSGPCVKKSLEKSALLAANHSSMRGCNFSVSLDLRSGLSHKKKHNRNETASSPKRLALSLLELRLDHPGHRARRRWCGQACDASCVALRVFAGLQGHYQTLPESLKNKPIEADV